MTKEEFELLKQIAQAVEELPFGESMALPWCRDSFPKLDQAINEWNKFKQKCDSTNSYGCSKL